jgi:glycosyltransferase involved in cell wall biosynthesis
LMKIIALSPRKIFSGFETSFFDAVSDCGATLKTVEVELPVFKILCTIKSFDPDKKKWALGRDLLYHTSITAFRRKSRFARDRVRELSGGADAIYQIGSLWNPLDDDISLPLFLQVDYTSQLSKKRNSEWKRKEGIEEEFWKEQERILYNKSEKILSTTENARRSIVDDYGIDPAKVMTVGAGVSAPYDSLEDGRLPDYNSRKILFVGKGLHGKGLDTLLTAFKTVRKTMPDSQLTIIGPTDLRLGGDGINYLGRIADRNLVRDLYFQHAVFAMPSRFEPVGQVFLEAMSCRLPCIGTTVDAMPEIIDHGRTGFIIEPGNSKSLAEYLLRTLGDADLAGSLGNAGYARLRSDYTWPVVGKKIYEAIASSLESA